MLQHLYLTERREEDVWETIEEAGMARMRKLFFMMVVQVNRLITVYLLVSCI